ncbi:MAG: hypothetical protein AB8F94_01155 [Saprospiraceae bacterium]
MKNAIVLITCLFLLGNFNTNAQWGSIKKAAKKVGSTTKKYAKKGGKKTWNGAKKAGSTTKKYASKGGKKVWSGAKTAGRVTKKYATKGGKLVFNGGKVFAGVVVSSSGTILFQGYKITKEVVVNGRIPKYRRVTKQEYNFANKNLFGGTLPPRSKILITNLLGIGNREFVWPTGTGHFLMNMGSAGYKNALKDEGLFIHEIAHVWQLHVTADINWTIGGISSQVKNSTSSGSVYGVKCNSSWGSMNLEQQATVAEKCFLDRKNGKYGRCFEKKVIKYIRKGKRFN